MGTKKAAASNTTENANPAAAAPAAEPPKAKGGKVSFRCERNVNHDNTFYPEGDDIELDLSKKEHARDAEELLACGAISEKKKK